MFRKVLLAVLWVISLVTAEPAHIVPGAYVVEFEDGQDVSPFENLVNVRKIMDFDFPLFKGASIQYNDEGSPNDHMKQLLSVPSVKNVWPKRRVPGPNVRVDWTASKHAEMSDSYAIKRGLKNETYSPHVQTQVNKLIDRGITGKGVKIAIIDSGIDYRHPALGGCFGPDCLVIGGHEFVGDKYNGSNVPVPDADPHDDCNGHGTHVAGIIAAQDNQFGFTGAAPGVKLAAYRVFGCDGFAENDILIAAFMRAHADGAQIITASLGGSAGWQSEELSVLVSRIVDAGVIVTVSAGNDGRFGMFYASQPAGGRNVAAVASFDNSWTPTLWNVAKFSVGGAEETSFDYAVGSPQNWSDVKLPLWAPSFNTSEVDQGCNPYPDTTPDLSNKVVLIRRGTCNFRVKAQIAVARGAKYIIIYNNVPDPLFQLSRLGPNISAVAMVTARLGISWVNDLAAGKSVTLNMIKSKLRLEAEVNNKTGGAISDYSSWGPLYQGQIKPQFGAPGGNILSTYPTALGSYAVLSGTSMACPMVAAIYALLSNARNTTDPIVLQNYLAASAKPTQLNEKGAFRPLLAPAVQQGAGLLQVYDAAYLGTLLSHSSLSFNDTVRFVDRQEFTISNVGDRPVTYMLDTLGAATGYAFSNSTRPDPFPGLNLDGEYATVKLSDYQVTIPAGGKSTISVRVTPPRLDPARLPVYGGYITLNGTNGDKLSLPYSGIVGNLSAHVTLDSVDVSRRWAAPDFDPVESNKTFLLSHQTDIKNVTDDLPTVSLNMLFGSAVLNIEVVSTNNASRSLGHILDSPFLFNSRGQRQFFWNGQLADNTFASAGSYRFRVSALRVFGDAVKKDQYDVAESAPFTIRYTST